MGMNSKIILYSLLVVCLACTTPQEPTIEEKAQSVIDQITQPIFPNQSVNIIDFGAVGDGVADDSSSIAEAIQVCFSMGGGKVIVPKGTFLTGPIHLESNINLHLEEGARVIFKTNPAAYLPVVATTYEGIEIMNYSPLIYAKDKENIALTGKGIFDGQANETNWWPWCGKDIYGFKDGMQSQRDDHNIERLHRFNREQTPPEQRIFGEGHQLRPTFFEAYQCNNVLVSGPTFTNAPFWLIHPFKSTNVTVENASFISHGPNNDGCDPEYSKNVLIQNCLFDTGDDCIAIKSGRNEDGRRINLPSENIVVRNCIMKDGHGGVVMGSEISAGVKNVFVLNCEMSSPNLDRAIRIKTNTLRGGFVDGVYVKNLEVGQVKEAALKINTYYGIYGIQEGEFIPRIENIYFENVSVENGGKYGVLIQGRPEQLVRNIFFKNVVIKASQEKPLIENADPIQLVNSSIQGL